MIWCMCVVCLWGDSPVKGSLSRTRAFSIPPGGFLPTLLVHQIHTQACLTLCLQCLKGHHSLTNEDILGLPYCAALHQDTLDWDLLEDPLHGVGLLTVNVKLMLTAKFRVTAVLTHCVVCFEGRSIGTFKAQTISTSHSWLLRLVLLWTMVNFLVSMMNLGGESPCERIPLIASNSWQFCEFSAYNIIGYIPSADWTHDPWSGYSMVWKWSC